MSEITTEQLTTALAIQKLGSDTEYIKLQLKNLNDAMNSFATKAELDEVRKDTTKEVTRFNKARAGNYENDKEEVKNIEKGKEQTQRIIWIGTGVLATIAVIAPYVVPRIISSFTG